MKKSNFAVRLLTSLISAIPALLTVSVAIFLLVKITRWWNYKEPVLVDLSPRASWLDTKQQVDEKAKEAVEIMIADAEANGICLVVSSGYRTIEEQEKLKGKYNELAEKPGESEHHTGLAVDFVGCPMTDGKRDDGAERLELEKPFEELPEYQWLKKNAKNYGFKQSYAKEPWHWRLVKRKEFNEIISPIPGITEEPTTTPSGSLKSQPVNNKEKVSWYGNDYCEKHNPTCVTASGEKFDDTAYTCACSNLYPLGTWLRFTFQGRSVTARCNDRGSFAKYGRIADLSKATFEALSSLEKGVLLVEVEEIK